MSRILIADDIEENRYYLEVLLRGRGHEVIVASNGAEALERLREQTPDLIVTDILMPVMDGFALCRECKKDPTLARIPLVFYTATYTDPRDKAFGLSLGAHRYLVKPIEPDPLIEELNGALEEGSCKRSARTQSALEDDSRYLKEHNEALIRKLEAKMAQLETANERLSRELSERKQAEIQLQRLYTAIENTEECIIIADAQGKIEYVNPAFEKVTGFSKDETLYLDPDHMPVGQHDTSFYQALWLAMLQGKPWKGHLEKKSRAGKHLEFEITMSPIPDTSRGTTGFVSVLRDVTEQRRLEDQLVQSQKIEALGTLSGGIAHDFNNILSAIIGYTDLTLYDIPEESKIRRNLMSVLAACDRARDLVRQILTFSRKAERRSVMLDLVPLLKESIKFLSAALPSSIEIRTCLETVSAIVLADPVQMHQVLLNIGTNAAYAMRDTGGVMEVALREVEFDEDTATQYPDLLPARYVLLSISDTGCGMSKEILSRIYEPFFTTKKEGEGTGLGLSVAHGIVRSHGGALLAYSEEGRGSTFNVYLPAARGAPQDQEGVDSLPVPGGTEKILFIDDEEALVDIGEQILSRLGYQVVTSTSGIEALKIFQSDPNDFDMVITDQTMPRIAGTELAAEMLKIRSDIPIILCTGFSVGIRDQDRAAAGIRSVLTKPLVIKEIARTTRAILDGARLDGKVERVLQRS